jgi:hypothetical protein
LTTSTNHIPDNDDWFHVHAREFIRALLSRDLVEEAQLFALMFQACDFGLIHPSCDAMERVLRFAGQLLGQDLMMSNRNFDMAIETFVAERQRYNAKPANGENGFDLGLM